MFVQTEGILLSEQGDREVMAGIIDASAESVWAILRDFNSPAKWIKAIVNCISNGNQIGSIRTLTLANGGIVRERLETIRDEAMILDFQILESPLPLAGYSSSMRIMDLGNQQCLLIWISQYPKNTPESAKTAAQSIHQMGYEGLRNFSKKE